LSELSNLILIPVIFGGEAVRQGGIKQEVAEEAEALGQGDVREAVRQRGNLNRRKQSKQRLRGKGEKRGFGGGALLSLRAPVLKTRRRGCEAEGVLNRRAQRKQRLWGRGEEVPVELFCPLCVLL